MFLTFDTETTGLPKNFKADVSDSDNWPRLVQLAWQLNDETGKLISNNSLIVKPEGFTIPYNSEKVHGISTEKALKEGEGLEGIIQKFEKDVKKSKYIIGHNINFDLKIIGAEHFRLSFNSNLNDKINLDTGQISKKYCNLKGGLGGGLKMPKLIEMYEILFNEKFSDAHDASHDVNATAKCFFELAKKGEYANEDLSADNINYEGPQLTKSNFQDEEIKDFKKSYRKQIENGESVTPNLAPRSNDDQWFDWEPFMNRKWYEEVATSVPQKEIEENALSIVKTPADFSLQKKVKKIFDERVKMSQGDIKLNWGFAEMMAYSSLLKEGYPIRFTGQDVRRGTFDHRHAVIFDQENGEGFLSLDSIAKEGKTLVDIYDSLLSEEAVLGFEYGYSATWPNGLVIWEAQFGDFANGAQVVIDQFIVSAEHKWERLSGLVMLLPHGFEGMGPEHSSARLERFLQLCAANNIQVCMPSSPSQIFHLLRRQAIRKMRRPLIVITPKSLLRLPEAASDLSELTNGSFNCIIGDDLPTEKIKRVVLCSGKVYYDLKKARDEKGISDVALLRLEQLYPFPYFEVEEMLKGYSHVEEFIWAQEEPRNQGAWFSHRHRLERVLNKLNIENSFKPISRPPAAAPAVGLMKLHLQQQQELVDNVLKRDNK